MLEKSSSWEDKHSSLAQVRLWSFPRRPSLNTLILLRPGLLTFHILLKTNPFKHNREHEILNWCIYWHNWRQWNNCLNDAAMLVYTSWRSGSKRNVKVSKWWQIHFSGQVKSVAHILLSEGTWWQKASSVTVTQLNTYRSTWAAQQAASLALEAEDEAAVWMVKVG